ncbi:hypothetical protein FHR20_000746 [Sphingomonas leidyi]|uniref:DUF4153 domain-containing protein n=1 Tax=Sphingomonas leidyi TaxID=68569 RepID=A0A7X5UX09_9SPHN|nr:DUF4153 domain-containing protein [Sphingomonas leidyi]NIJ63815.1 hypothetical protein [Sphingomonas leidyi]
MDEIETRAEFGEAAAPEGWAARPLLLAGLGLATGVAAHLILGGSLNYRMEWSALQAAALIGVTLFAAMIGFTIERRLWWTSIAFGAVIGVAAGFVTWWNGAPGGWSASEGWRTMSLLLAVAVAAPLFQAARDEGAPRTPYAAVHDYAWQNVVLWFACWLFVAIVWVMAWLLASLFQLIKIELLHELLMKNWFVRALIGLAFGAALGLLREHDAVVRLLQRVVATVLAVLAPVLAIGLGLFLLALPFTGLQALWDATSATTPLLLSCAVGALILANAVIGNRPEEERRNRLLRYGAMLLAMVILPLAVLAAVATGLRVGQYGYTPERLWAIVFVGIAILYGAAYLGSLVLGRLAWTVRVRPANLALAFLLCGLGLLLATPLINFNRISTDDQVGRLESGRISAAKFDWRALAFDFGKPGRDALERLRRSKNAGIRGKAAEAAKAESRWDLEMGDVKSSPRSGPKSAVLDNARVLPEGASVPRGLIDLLADKYQCRQGNLCTILVANPAEAVVFADSCYAGMLDKDGKARRIVTYCGGGDRFVLADGAWKDAADRFVPSAEQRAQIAAGYPAGRVEIRPVERRQVFVGGVPVGEPFE